MRLFARLALRQRTYGMLAQAGAIGIAFGGKDAARSALDALDDPDG